MFLAVCCFIQHLRGLTYLLENSAFSDIFLKSPLAVLRDLPHHVAQLDQCAVGGMLEGQPIKKSTHFQSNESVEPLECRCPGGHKHYNLRGGTRAAASAKYPDGECLKILATCGSADGVSEGGG